MAFTSSNGFNPLEIYRSYPEQNPYDIQPPIFNLAPHREAEDHDTPELKKAVLDIARRTGINVLRQMCGDFPFLLSYLDEEIVTNNPVPFTQYQPPPPLAKIDLPDDVEFIRQINEAGNTPIFEVKVEGNTWLLKMFPAFGPVPEGYRTSRRPLDESNRPLDPVRRLMREREAYAHLKQAGLCEQGHVPDCYGWTELRQVHVDAIAQVIPGLTYEDGQNIEDLLDKAYDGLFPKGILLEYFPDAQVMSIHNVTYDLGEKAVRSLYAIHAAHVLHGNVRRRNILLLPDGRVVWIDFDSSLCASDPQLRRLDLYLELQGGWSVFFRQLIPNKRIGWEWDVMFR